MRNAPEMVLPSPVPSAPLAEFRNLTPFPSLCFQSVDPADQVFHVAVLRLTYSLRRATRSGALILSDGQTPLATSDVHEGAPNASSLRWESDLAPYKPSCDVLLTGAIAHSPGGTPQPRWPVGIEVGGWRKTLAVAGPRDMVWRDGQPEFLGEPEPVVQVPLQYERAFGGQVCFPLDVAPAERQLWQVDERNPLGCGFVTDEWLRRTGSPRCRAPQIEWPDQPFTGQPDYAPAGFGAVARSWLPRRHLAGTHDDDWKAHRWPRLPLDHDYAYWNCAPADQQIPYPVGGERIVLHHLHRAPRVEFRLPAHQVFGLIRLQAGPIVPKAMSLDTLIIDLARYELVCVHRLVVPASADVRVIEARLEMEKED